MDQEHFIKIQPESPEKQPAGFNNYITHFYDNDSEVNYQGFIKEQDSSYLSPRTSQSLLERLDQNIDLRTMSFDQIKNYALLNFIISESFNWKQFESLLKKRKMLLKRIHAKNRHFTQKKNGFYVVQQDNCQGSCQKSQNPAEIKKKRNRISAQISRDRKKIKIIQLQTNNQKLKAETELMAQQNLRLKRQLEEFNRTQQRKVQISSKSNNRFISMLILFGIFFLLSVVKSSFKPSIKSGQKIAKPSVDVLSGQDQTKMISNSQKLIQSMEKDGENWMGNEKVIKKVLLTLDEMKMQTEDIQLPKRLKQNVKMVIEKND